MTKTTSLFKKIVKAISGLALTAALVADASAVPSSKIRLQDLAFVPIISTNTLQAGTTFYSSSGTVAGELNVLGSLKFSDGTYFSSTAAYTADLLGSTHTWSAEQHFSSAAFSRVCINGDCKTAWPTGGGGSGGGNFYTDPGTLSRIPYYIAADAAAATSIVYDAISGSVVFPSSVTFSSNVVVMGEITASTFNAVGTAFKVNGNVVVDSAGRLYPQTGVRFADGSLQLSAAFGNMYTDPGVAGQLAFYVAADSIAPSGLDPTRVRTSTIAITSADVNSSIRITTTAITSADVNSSIRITTVAVTSADVDNTVVIATGPYNAANLSGQLSAGVLPATVRLTTVAITSADTNSSIRITTVPITGADIVSFDHAKGTGAVTTNGIGVTIAQGSTERLTVQGAGASGNYYIGWNIGGVWYSANTTRAGAMFYFRDDDYPYAGNSFLMTYSISSAPYTGAAAIQTIDLNTGQYCIGTNYSNCGGKLGVLGNINVASGYGYLLNGTSINTAGTLTNVAYKNQDNKFTAGQTVYGQVTVTSSFTAHGGVNPASVNLSTVTTGLAGKVSYSGGTGDVDLNGYSLLAAGLSVATAAFTGAASTVTFSGWIDSGSVDISSSCVIPDSAGDVSCYASCAVAGYPGYRGTPIGFSHSDADVPVYRMVPWSDGAQVSVNKTTAGESTLIGYVRCERIKH